MMRRSRIALLILVAGLLLVGILGFSFRLLPDAPLAPTPTYPEGIDFPDSRPVPAR